MTRVGYKDTQSKKGGYKDTQSNKGRITVYVLCTVYVLYMNLI